MSKMKNHRIYSTDIEWLKMLKEENDVYIGRPCKLDVKNGCLTIFALPPQRRKKKAERSERDKRNEKFERRA